MEDCLRRLCYGHDGFLLLMWLLGSTTQGDKEGISDYFKTPLKIALQGGDGSGDSSSILKGGGEDLTRQTGQRKRADFENLKQSVDLKTALALQERIELQQLKNSKRR